MNYDNLEGYFRELGNFKLFINMCYIILFNILYNRNNAKASILNDPYININKSHSNHEGKIVDIFDKIQEYFVLMKMEYYH